MQTSDFELVFPGRLVNTTDATVAFVPDPLPPLVEITREIQRAAEKAMFALGGLQNVIPWMPNPELLTSPFLRREALLSSKIEGTHTTYEQLYLFELEQEEHRDTKYQETSSKRDTREVANYIRALHEGLRMLKTLPPCGRIIRAMHQVLMTGVEQRDDGAYVEPGAFRSTLAYISSGPISAARYVAPPASELQQLFANLEQNMNSYNGALPMLAWIAIIHYQFEAIHPFADGNGRIGRLLISLLLAHYGILTEPLLYLSAYFERNKDEYNRRLWEISRSNRWTEWILFFLEGVRSEAIDATMRAKTLHALRESWRSQLREMRGKILSVVDQLFQVPVLTIPTAQRVMQIQTYRGAQKCVDKLVENGMLTLLSDKVRPKLFVAEPILDILQAPSPATLPA